ncbi:hypothetical protein CEP54_009621 [Fusarium duplospermum]|uniref:Uncharacterized protein n=1 Tax=Fusarium duplospermum TaxID=1325734 RepID=A0A428PPI4_9HYPO|nr:hypothetical protein CEP54_009621 [Fusarium duplospermum]
MSTLEQLPGTSVTNGPGDQEEQVSIFAMPGTEAEEAALWLLSEEAPVTDTPGPPSTLDLTTATLDDI